MKRFAIVKDGIVVNVILWDGLDASFAEHFEGSLLEELPDDSPVGPGWTHDGGEFIPPAQPPVPPITVEQASAERDRLMAYATAQIAPLQDAVDMEEATPAEVAALAAWKKYRLAVSRTSTSPGWPEAVQWPALPPAQG